MHVVAQLCLVSREYLLAHLLYLTEELLDEKPPEDIDSTLGGSLAPDLLKTLFVCFLRASMATEVSGDLWDKLQAVASSRTQWKVVVTQWKVSMEYRHVSE